MTLAYPPNPIVREADLVREILCGRRDLFGDLIKPHLRALVGIIHRITGPHPDVEDIVQQATLKAFVNLRQFRGDASFGTWLVQIGLNEARQWRRKSLGPRVVPLEVVPSRLAMADRGRSPLEQFQCTQLAEGLRSAAAQLPVKYRAVFQLDLQEVSIDETARRLGLKIAAAKTRRLRARLKIASLLNRRDARS